MNRYNFPIFWGLERADSNEILQREHRWEGCSLLFFAVLQISLSTCPTFIWIEHRKGQLLVILFHILKLISLGFYNYLMTVFKHILDLEDCSLGSERSNLIPRAVFLSSESFSEILHYYVTYGARLRWLLEAAEFYIPKTYPYVGRVCVSAFTWRMICAFHPYLEHFYCSRRKKNPVIQLKYRRPKHES